MKTHITIGIAAIALTGCSASLYTSSAAKFGTATTEAMTRYVKEFDDFEDQFREDALRSLANERVALTTSPECEALEIQPEHAPDCTLVRINGQDAGISIGLSETRMLALTLAEYAEQLAKLANPDPQDAVNYKSAVTSLFGSISGLHAELASSPSTQEAAIDRFNAGGTILAELATQSLQVGRARALKDIIIATNPLVQLAAVSLANDQDIMSGIILNRMAVSLETAVEAQNQLAETDAANPEILYKANAQLIKLTRQRANAARPNNMFDEIADAHQHLTDIANGPLPASAFYESVSEILASANTIKSAIKTAKE